jgi:acyl-CoA thioesterase I
VGLSGAWRVRGSVCAVLALVFPACGGSGGRGPGPVPTPPGPTLQCPDNRQASAVQGQPTPIQYDLPVAQHGQAPVSVTCTPESGTAFAIGETTVTCTATDAIARTASCTFLVAVTRVPQLAVTRILAFGDSLTEGTISPDPITLAVNKPDSYPFQLQELLAARYTDQTIEVVNEGCGGEWSSGGNSNCDGGVQRLPGVIDRHEPQVVLLMHGANDLRRSSRTISNIVGAMEDMVERVQREGAVAFVASLPPQNPDGSRGDAAGRLPEYTRQLSRMADDEDAVFVDLYGIMGSWQGYIGVDGLHPTPVGYRRIAEIFQEAIQSRFERAEAPAPTIRFTRR